MTKTDIRAPIAAGGTPANATQAHTPVFIRALTAVVDIRANMAADMIASIAPAGIIVTMVTIIVAIIVITAQPASAGMIAITIAVAITVLTTAIIPVPITAVYKTATQARIQAFIRVLIAAEFIQVCITAHPLDCA